MVIRQSPQLEEEEEKRHLKPDIIFISKNRELMANFSVEEVMAKQRAKGPATVLAIGTATPPNCYPQSDYPDFYFRATKSEHMTQLKEKLKRICKSLFCPLFKTIAFLDVSPN